MDEKLDIRNPNISDKDIELDKKLRPLQFNDFKGQKQIVENLEQSGQSGQSASH